MVQRRRDYPKGQSFFFFYLIKQAVVQFCVGAPLKFDKQFCLIKFDRSWRYGKINENLIYRCVAAWHIFTVFHIVFPSLRPFFHVEIAVFPYRMVFSHSCHLLSSHPLNAIVAQRFALRSPLGIALRRCTRPFGNFAYTLFFFTRNFRARPLSSPRREIDPSQTPPSRTLLPSPLGRKAQLEDWTPPSRTPPMGFAQRRGAILLLSTCLEGAARHRILSSKQSRKPLVNPPLGKAVHLLLTPLL